MFLGTHSLRLDDKGRLFLPAKYRDDLSEGVVITRGQERCLSVWPRDGFARFTEALRASAPERRPSREVLRMLFAGASDEQPDRQGRVTVPGPLRRYAGLDRDCTVVGAYDKLEIWDTAAWESYQSEKEPGFADVPEEVLPGLI